VLEMNKNRSIAICIVFLLLSLLFSASVAQEDYLSAKDALKYVGQKKTVCGDVVSVTYAMRSRGQPTFLNLDEPYPNQVFTVVIWGSDRVKFKNPPEVFFKGKRICITGIIDTFRGKPQIIVRDPNQIKIR